MKDNDDSTLIEVFTGSPWEAELIKGLLESNGVPATTKDTHLSAIAPYVSNGVMVMVNEDDYTQAVDIVESREEAEK